MFEGFFEVVATILGWFYGVTHSYGGAIVLLTIAVMIITSPLTLKSTRSMVQMQRLQPELKRLQTKYKDDRERLNQEMMAFYKANNINPLGGCVPVLIQAPVFLILYRVLRGVTERVGGTGSGLGHLVGQHVAGVPTSKMTPWKLTSQPFHPQHLDAASKLYKSLSTSTKMNFLGMDLSLSPSDALKIGLVTAIPFLLLMVLMLVSQIIQNRQIQGRASNTQTSSQQQMIMKFLPFMLPIFSFGFPAGLGVYYLVQGVCRMGLQQYITKTVFHPSATGQPIIASSVETDTADDGSAGSKSAKSSTAKAPTSKAAAAKPDAEPKSAKSAAVQRKVTDGSKPETTRRRSGAPRQRSERGSGNDGPERKK